VYDSRAKTSEVLAALAQGKDVFEDFAVVTTALQNEVSRLGESIIALSYARFVRALSTLRRLLEWRHAVRSAEVEADRFLRSALVEAKALAHELNADPDATALAVVANKVLHLNEVDQVPGIAELLLHVPLPLPLFINIEPRGRAPGQLPSVQPEVSVAFLSFSLQDGDFADPQTIEPELLHDLSVEVRVSRWPQGAEELVLDAVSAEPPDVYSLPRFSFQRPDGDPPYTLRKSGRMLLRVPQALAARPLEFAYRAWFSPESCGARLVVEGQRHLRVQSYDPERNPISGYAEVDQRLIAIRREARMHPGVRDKPLGSFLTILAALGGIAGQALQDGLFHGKWTESRFHRDMLRRLRDRKEIGSELEEHPRAGGGLTDLSFQRIRIELKVEPNQYVSTEEAGRFLGQTSQYVVGSDSRFGVLCLLDCSPKTGAPASVANDIALQTVLPPGSAGGVPLFIGVVIVRGNLATPSDLSKG
jgi:hypothetical protein